MSTAIDRILAIADGKAPEAKLYLFTAPKDPWVGDRRLNRGASLFEQWDGEAWVALPDRDTVDGTLAIAEPNLLTDSNF